MFPFMVKYSVKLVFLLNKIPPFLLREKECLTMILEFSETVFNICRVTEI